MRSGYASPGRGAPVLREDPELARAFGHAARQAGYHEAGLAALLSVGGEPVAVSATTQPRLRARCMLASAGALGVWARLFLLRCHGDDAPSEATVRAALDPVPLEALAAAGVLRVSEGRVTSWLQLVADDGGLVLSDPGGVSCDPDHVMALGPSSLELWALSPASVAGRRVAELGTGSGALALRWARRGASVVATDVNRRALTMARWNLALSPVVLDVTLRLGDRFEPLGGERFDLIAMNAPFVIGAPARLVYRDGGQPGDAFAASVVSGALPLLLPGGSLRMTLAWVCQEGIDPWERLRGWLPEGARAWALARLDQPADAYVESWLGEAGAVQQPAYRAHFGAWSEALQCLGASRVRTGLLVLRAATQATATQATAPQATATQATAPQATATLVTTERVDGIDAALGAVVSTLLRTSEGVAAMVDESLLAAVIVPASGVRYSQSWLREGQGWTAATCLLETTVGLHARVQVEPVVASVLVACDGVRPLAAILRDVATASGLAASMDTLASAICAQLRLLVAAGLWTLAETPVETSVGAAAGPTPD